MTDTERPDDKPTEPTQPSSEAPTPSETPQAKRVETEAELAAIRAAGARFAGYVLTRARQAPDVLGAMLAARDAVRSAEADERVLGAALAATMPASWLDEVTATWLGGMTRGEAECTLAAFASFWVLGFDKGRDK